MSAVFSQYRAKNDMVVMLAEPQVRAVQRGSIFKNAIVHGDTVSSAGYRKVFLHGFCSPRYIKGKRTTTRLRVREEPYFDARQQALLVGGVDVFVGTAGEDAFVEVRVEGWVLDTEISAIDAKVNAFEEEWSHER